MKKRNRIERKRALKEAYYNELKKMNVIGTPEVKTYEKMTKAELIEECKALGIELDMKLTKAEMIASIERHNEPIVIVEGFEGATEEQIEAIVNADVEEIKDMERIEQAKEDGKSIEEVVNEIAEETLKEDK